jgi:low affinity Fe/Cu permease
MVMSALFEPSAEQYRSTPMSDVFRRFAAFVSHIAGTPWAFLCAILVILLWGVTGPLFAFSDTWQLVINTGTTIVTFLMVFLIQNTQNRDTKALHAKLDELIIHMVGADNRLVTAEDLSEEQLAQLKAHFEKLSHNGESSFSRRQRSDKKPAETKSQP